MSVYMHDIAWFEDDSNVVDGSSRGVTSFFISIIDFGGFQSSVSGFENRIDKILSFLSILSTSSS